MQFNGLVANVCLFRVNDTIRSGLIEFDRVFNLFEESKSLASIGLSFCNKTGQRPKFDLDVLVHSLCKLSAIFGTCQLRNQDDEATHPEIPKPLEMSFTETEESWIRNTFDQVQVQFRGVVPSGQFFGELFSLLCHGNNVSLDFSFEWMAIVTERARRVLRNIPEFQALPEKDQVLSRA